MAKKTKTAPRPHARGHDKTAKTRAKQTGTIRMYKLQLGDCFLLTFPTDAGGEFHVLIDCGLIKGAENAPARMQQVAKDIEERTEGVIDLLLITHEHWDHLSGFEQARDIFEDIKFKELWLAWTEDPSDKLATKLRKERQSRHQTLQLAVDRLTREPGAAVDGGVEMAKALLAFAGELGAADGGGTAGALNWVKEHAGEKNIRYCSPGDLLELPGVSGARVYVLGPPHDEDLLRRSTPSARHPETYLLPAEEQLRFLLEPAGADDDPGALPFDQPFRLTREQARQLPFFQENYGFADGDDKAWRRVDTDWQGAIGPLALQLDSDTNNTSLAIAIELLPARQILLFPGDAQVGNWLSWQDLSWKDPQDNGAKVTMKELFERTVLYKVGHHGSHNATLREKGLEMMTADGLVALLPVVEDFAHRVKHWQMPWPDLYKELIDRTGGRILRPDQENRNLSGIESTELYIDVPMRRAKGS